MSSPVKTWRETKQLNKFLGRKGRLLVWTRITTAPTGFEYQAPYFAGIVEWTPSTDRSGLTVRMPVQVVDCSENDLKENMEVVAVIRRTKKPRPNDVIEYSIKVKPLTLARDKND